MFLLYVASSPVQAARGRTVPSSKQIMLEYIDL